MFTEAAAEPGPQTAIYRPVPGFYVIYDAKPEFIQALNENDYDRAVKFILGAVSLYELTALGNKDVMAIRAIAAKNKFGPLLYYITMYHEKWLAPHNSDVTERAQSVWRYFFENNFKKIGIKNYHPEEKPWMKHAYSFPSVSMRAKYYNISRNGRAVHDQFIQMSDVYSSREIDTLISELADSMLDQEMQAIYGSKYEPGSDEDIDKIRELAGIQPSIENENISITGSEKGRIQREKNIEPGTEEWFKLWFSRPHLT